MVTSLRETNAPLVLYKSGHFHDVDPRFIYNSLQPHFHYTHTSDTTLSCHQFIYRICHHIHPTTHFLIHHISSMFLKFIVYPSIS